MKIYIGPFRSRWISNIHTNYMHWKYGRYEWDENTNWFENSLEKFEDALQWIYNHTVNLILDKRSSQKIKVRIDSYDTWSMDSTLTHIILPMLKQLKDTKHGSPFVDPEDVPEHLRPPEGQEDAWKNGDVDDNHHPRWDWVIDEMIWAFEQINSDWEDQYTTGECDWKFEKIEDGEHKGHSRMVEGPNHTAVTDWDGRKAHQERMNHGFLLFGKYFQSLWD